MVAPSAVGTRVGVGEGGASGCSVGGGETSATAVGWLGDGDRETTGDSAGDEVGDGGAVTVAVSGGSVCGGCGAAVARRGVGVVAGVAGAVGIDVEAARGAAATGAVVGTDGTTAAVATGTSIVGGARVGTITLGVSVTSPLHATSEASANPSHRRRNTALAQDPARVVQRRTMIFKGRRSLLRASNSD